jgi:hypothetical protein
VAFSTTGPTATSWFDLDTANMTIADYVGTTPDIPVGFQFTADQQQFFIRACSMISNLWSYDGQHAQHGQTLAWPRCGFKIKTDRDPYQLPFDPWYNRDNILTDWSLRTIGSWAGFDPYLYDFIHYEYPGLSLWKTFPSDQVPSDIQTAAIVLSALLIAGATLWEDDGYNAKSVSQSGDRIDPINAMSRCAIVFELMAKWGTFIGADYSTAGGARA